MVPADDDDAIAPRENFAHPRRDFVNRLLSNQRRETVTRCRIKGRLQTLNDQNSFIDSERMYYYIMYSGVYVKRPIFL